MRIDLGTHTGWACSCYPVLRSGVSDVSKHERIGMRFYGDETPTVRASPIQRSDTMRLDSTPRATTIPPPVSVRFDPTAAGATLPAAPLRSGPTAPAATNTASGFQALSHSTTGVNSTTGFNNTTSGASALRYNEGGSHNTASGVSDSSRI